MSEEAKLQRDVNRYFEENQRQFDNEPTPDPSEKVPPGKRLTVCENIQDRKRDPQIQDSSILEGIVLILLDNLIYGLLTLL